MHDTAAFVERRAFTSEVEPDIERPGRYRWTIFENGRPRDRSTYSYATKREAGADAARFVQKLDSTWGNTL